VNTDEELWRGAQVLVVDDEPSNVALIEHMLGRNGFTQVRSTTDPRCFREIFLEQQPDIVLIDLHMPHLDGLALLHQVAELRDAEEYLPVLVLSADATSTARIDALSAGASDFLIKPLDTAEVGLRVRNYLDARRLHLRLAGDRRALDGLVQERTAELERAHLATLRRLNLVSEFRDDATNEHTHRVGTAAARLTEVAGGPPELAMLVEQAAPLHDLGKVGVPDSVLLKPGRLTPEEFELIRAHPTIGGQIIGDTTSEVLNVARVIAETHHERWNGEGYPSGLRGEDIPLPGRIVAVCDVFDALTHERPYKQAWSVEEAVTELETQRGAFFDPDLVDLFVGAVLPGLPWVAEGPGPGAVPAGKGPAPTGADHPRAEAPERRWRVPPTGVGNNAGTVAGGSTTIGRTTGDPEVGL
jgi:putative two-component system response regulator